MPLMPPDSAWRQYRTAATERAALAAKTTRAKKKDWAAEQAAERAEQQEDHTAAIWLQVLLEGFEERRETHRLDGKDAAGLLHDRRGLADMGLPCADCLLPVPYDFADHDYSVATDEERKTFPVIARCGKIRVDPIGKPMPPLISPKAVRVS